MDSEAEGVDNPGSHSCRAVGRADKRCNRQTVEEAVGDNHNLKNIIAVYYKLGDDLHNTSVSQNANNYHIISK